MATQRPILIAGGGPVGVITALALARQGLPVHVFEAETKVNDMPRAASPAAHAPPANCRTCRRIIVMARPHRVPQSWHDVRWMI